jgi:hypothetical protein
MPEELALEQPLGQGRAVDRHDRLVGAAAVLMDELRDHFLARAALAADEDRRVGPRDLAGELDRLAERGRNPDEGDLVAVAVLLHQLQTKVLCLTRDHHGVRRPTDQHLQVSRRERLRQIVPGAGPERLDAARDARVPGHDDDDGVLEGLQRGLEDLEPGDLRHVQIHQDDVELAPLDRVDGLFAPADQRHVVAIHLQDTGAAFPQGALVIHHEDPDTGLDVAWDGKRVPRGRFGPSGRPGRGRLCEGTAHGDSP